jgi:hypothetical protein
MTKEAPPWLEHLRERGYRQVSLDDICGGPLGALLDLADRHAGWTCRMDLADALWRAPAVLARAHPLGPLGGFE